MSIMPPGSDSKPDTPPSPCASLGCDNQATLVGVYDDGDCRERVTYCTYCAGLLHQEFTPTGGVEQLDLRAQIVADLPLPGETMTVDAYQRIVDDLLLRPSAGAR